VIRSGPHAPDAPPEPLLFMEWRQAPYNGCVRLLPLLLLAACAANGKIDLTREVDGAWMHTFPEATTDAAYHAAMAALVAKGWTVVRADPVGGSFSAKSPVAEGVIDELRSIEGVEFAMTIREPPVPDGPARRISMRSSSDAFDVSALARQRGRSLETQTRVNQLVIEDMHDGVVVLDRQGRVVQHNPQAQRLLGESRLLGALIADILPSGVVNIVQGFGVEAGKPLASSPRVAKVAFTGETTTGRLIMQYASENLIPVTLELGGKSPSSLS